MEKENQPDCGHTTTRDNSKVAAEEAPVGRNNSNSDSGQSLCNIPISSCSDNVISATKPRTKPPTCPENQPVRPGSHRLVKVTTRTKIPRLIRGYVLRRRVGLFQRRRSRIPLPINPTTEMKRLEGKLSQQLYLNADSSKISQTQIPGSKIPRPALKKGRRNDTKSKSSNPVRHRTNRQSPTHYDTSSEMPIEMTSSEQTILKTGSTSVLPRLPQIVNNDRRNNLNSTKRTNRQSPIHNDTSSVMPIEMPSPEQTTLKTCGTSVLPKLPQIGNIERCNNTKSIPSIKVKQRTNRQIDNSPRSVRSVIKTSKQTMGNYGGTSVLPKLPQIAEKKSPSSGNLRRRLKDQPALPDIRKPSTFVDQKTKAVAFSVSVNDTRWTLKPLDGQKRPKLPTLMQSSNGDETKFVSPKPTRLPPVTQNRVPSAKPKSSIERRFSETMNDNVLCRKSSCMSFQTVPPNTDFPSKYTVLPPVSPKPPVDGSICSPSPLTPESNVSRSSSHIPMISEAHVGTDSSQGLLTPETHVGTDSSQGPLTPETHDGTDSSQSLLTPETQVSTDSFQGQLTSETHPDTDSPSGFVYPSCAVMTKRVKALMDAVSEFRPFPTNRPLSVVPEEDPTKPDMMPHPPAVAPPRGRAARRATLGIAGPTGRKVFYHYTVEYLAVNPDEYRYIMTCRYLRFLKKRLEYLAMRARARHELGYI